ncbi:MAG: kynureninase [Aeromicrobium sp.]|nr:kynureninase [Burkholderiales bacterium]
MLSRDECVSLDASDPLKQARSRFAIKQGTIYLDGNSLGALPISTAAAVQQTIDADWGTGLIRSWNHADWVNLPRTVGSRLAPLVGARPDEVIVADSTSVNIFKLLSAMLTRPGIRGDQQRRFVLSDRSNFPTDLYMAEGLLGLLGDRYELKLVDTDALIGAFDHTIAAALITQVDYRSGQLLDMRAYNARASQAGTSILWDLSHSAGAVVVDLVSDGAEFAVGCGYKYFNGGPGAPAFLFVRRDLQANLANPLSGWFGHAAPFAFNTNYAAATGVDRFQCGTPPVLALVALNEGLNTFEGIDLADIRKKSLALSDVFLSLMREFCDEFGFTCVSPTAHADRASHLSFAHAEAYPLMQAIIDRGVIGDFRQPDLLRFGFTPLYTRFTDCWDAVNIIRDVVSTESFRAPVYQQRNRVT